MSQKEVVITKGLPGSGKSTWAKRIVELEPGRWKRINKDDLRAMLDDSLWSKGNEKFVLKTRNAMIELSLSQGYSVIVDDTNLHPKHEETIRQLVLAYNKENNDNVKVTVKFFDTDLNECIKRDLKRAHPVGEKVIRGMYREFLEKPAPILQQNEDLPHAIIVDIDGTVAEKGKRNPFDWLKVSEDTPKKHIIALVKCLSNQGYNIIFLSGRDSICRAQTEQWLKAYIDIPEFSLYMRAENDNRNDAIIKKELFDTHIRGKYYVELVIDDRLRVCRMWHQEGLQLIRVGDPDADF